MAIKTTRRTFIKQAAMASAAGPLILSSTAYAGSSRKLRHASIGVGRRGDGDLKCFAAHPDIEIVALCDVDRDYLQAAAKRHPKARLYRDWRVLLEKEANNIDSINATVPNHMHAPISMTAMDMGKHVYCQKPLTHSIYESRALAEAAARKPELVTQMGVQSHSDYYCQLTMDMIQFGVIGKIKEAHSWDTIRYYYTGNFTDPPMRRRPDREDPVPETLEWDLWLGVAPKRPYVEDIYHTRYWRRWQDFGGGAQGDMAGHMMDVIFTGLDLTSPKWVMSHRSPPYEETYSPNNKVQYRFPGTKYTAGDIDYFWYDTGPIDTEGWPIAEKDLAGDGSMLVGEKGFLYIPHAKMPQALPHDDTAPAVEKFNKEVGPPTYLIDRYKKYGKPAKLMISHISDLEHYHQFVNACLGKGKTTTPFGYSGNLTESILMGTVVNRFPREKLIWDAQALRFSNKPEANQYLRREYRDGWHVEGLG